MFCAVNEVKAILSTLIVLVALLLLTLRVSRALLLTPLRVWSLGHWTGWRSDARRLVASLVLVLLVVILLVLIRILLLWPLIVLLLILVIALILHILLHLLLAVHLIVQLHVALEVLHLAELVHLLLLQHLVLSLELVRVVWVNLWSHLLQDAIVVDVIHERSSELVNGILLLKISLLHLVRHAVHIVRLLVLLLLEHPWVVRT